MIDWDNVIDEHGPMVWRTVCRLLGRTDDAQDCLQQVFLGALEISRRQRVRNWPGLLRRLATARAIDRLREQMKERRLYENNIEMDALERNCDSPVEKLHADELASRLRAALGQLPARQAEVFALHFFEQMSHRTISRILKLKTNAVGVLLHEARQKLRKLLIGPDERRTDQ